jgi:hypothetical protein
MSPPRQSYENTFRPADIGSAEPERRKQEMSEAARDLRAAERVQANKTAKLKALRLEREEADRLAKEAAAAAVPAKKKAAPRAKKKVEPTGVRRGHGSA